MRQAGLPGQGTGSLEADSYLDALLSLPSLSSAEISPDGRWAAWSWWHKGPAADVYVAPTDLSLPPVRLTRTNENTEVVSFSPDSRSLVVSQDHEGDERLRLYRVALDRPGVMEPLTEAEPHYYIQGGELTYDGRFLVYGANYDISTGREIEATWIYRQSLAGGERTVLARPLKPAFVAPQLNCQGTSVIYYRNDRHPSGQQVWLVGVDGRQDREILNFGPRAKVRASWLADGRRVVFVADAGSHRKLGILDSKTGKTTILIDERARNIESAFMPANATKAVVVAIEEAAVRASLLDPDSRAESALPAIDGNIIPLAPRADGMWVGKYYSSRQPADLVVFDPSRPDPSAFKSITRVWEQTQLKPGDFVRAEGLAWKGADGLTIHGFLYRARDPLGTIVYVHGGPTHHHDDSLDGEIQYYVRRGFNVLDPNYRGSTGYGLPFQEAIKDDGWGGREQSDIRRGIEELFARGVARPGKVGITGTSYGGYSAWMAITSWPPDIVAAAAPVCGMTDLLLDYNTTRPDLRPYSEEMMGGPPSANPGKYEERSPINRIAAIKGRVLIVQGLKDPNVTPANVSLVRKRLESLGKSYELMTFADEGHGVIRPKNERLLFRRIADFFRDAFAVNSGG